MKKSTEIIFVILTILLLGVIVYFSFFNEKKIDNVVNKNATLENIKKTDGMVNVYLFYGRECPHCEKLMEYFDDINDKYGELFNLYGFEVWHDGNNPNIMKNFSSAMGDELGGVPYYIIGDESFVGYNYTYDEKIVKAIKKYAKSGSDVYFDKIKK